jgi:hypothetical protein
VLPLKISIPNILGLIGHWTRGNREMNIKRCVLMQGTEKQEGSKSRESKVFLVAGKPG